MLRQLIQAMGSSWRRESAPYEWRFYIQSQMNGDFSNKKWRKIVVYCTVFRQPFRKDADFRQRFCQLVQNKRKAASRPPRQPKTHTEPSVVRCGNPKRM